MKLLKVSFDDVRMFKDRLLEMVFSPHIALFRAMSRCGRLRTLSIRAADCLGWNQRF